jgi:4-amino-4-deoxy-L-arabinose transferase-like glycosyltransferase
MTRRHWYRLARLFSPLLLILCAVVVFMTSVRDSGFWWADGASFALNGELVRDYLATGLGQNPMAFAEAWFRHYPALTISLYPPIFPLAEAAMFAVFGFSHATAQATVVLFAGAASFGLYLMMRTATGALVATAAGIMLLATPEVLFWSRQVVMDVPAMAFLLFAAAALLHYQNSLHDRNPRAAKFLYASVLLTLAAAYTKQTVLFVVPGFAVALLVEDGRALFRRKSTWIAIAAGLIGLAPLAVFTVLFAKENFHIAFGAGTGEPGVPRWSVPSLVAYGRVLPDIVGIVPLAGVLAYATLVAIKGWRGVAERRLAVLMMSWFVIDYLCISVTADFEPRYAMLLAVPPVALSTLLLMRLVRSRLTGCVALAASVVMFVVLIASQRVVRVDGYDDVAQYIIENTNQNDTILFHGLGSKNFSFALREQSAVPKLWVLRAEKFLVDYKIMRQWGITDRGLTSADIESIFDHNKISYVVFQPDFWTDQPSIAKLQRFVYSDRFRLVALFRISSEDPARSAWLRVYRTIATEQQASPEVTTEPPGPSAATPGHL